MNLDGGTVSDIEKYLGYFRYSGEAVKDGLLDARKSAEALLGFDEILRYFLLKEDPSLKEFDFEIPVRIRKGSWEVLIPTLIDKIISPEGMMGIYALAVVKKVATDGLFEIGIAKDIEKTFKGALKAAQWVIKIAIHIKNFLKKEIKGQKIEENEKGTFIKIPNEKNEYLLVPRKYFDLFCECPEKLFEKNTSIIEKERSLEIGVFENGAEEKISITEKEKPIFSSRKEDEDIIFPELIHNQEVELEGTITRGNEKRNTLGFEYQGHILTCRPVSGNIVTFKNKIISQDRDHFFLPVRIIGIVDRADQNGNFKEKKPQIIFSDIISLEQNNNQNLSLFD